ncbi:MAG: hypothetical protein R2697_12645 [Ilumatobacteraceae bacterium]
MTPTGRDTRRDVERQPPGDVVLNLVVCELAPDGALRLDSTASGYARRRRRLRLLGTTGDRLVTTSPRRLLDTRLGWARRRPAGPHGVDLQWPGSVACRPLVTALKLERTAISVGRRAAMAARAGGRCVDPSTSNLNLRAGDTIANLVICRIGDQQSVSLANPLADCDLIADVLGYFVP